VVIHDRTDELRQAILTARIPNDWRARLVSAVWRSGKKHRIIAEDAGITPSTLSRILNGRSQPHFEVVVRIAQAVGENVGHLLGEQSFELSSEQRAKVRTAAGILMDLTGGRSK
jgi:transcriptional regulator with XRE-family HTH domain